MVNIYQQHTMKKLSLLIIILFLSACTPANENEPSNPTPTEVPTPSTAVINISEIATHNTPQDCWIIVNNMVYDVTEYIVNHPAGAKTITDTCGAESTAAFDNIKDGRGHSPSANRLLADYLLGPLE